MKLKFITLTICSMLLVGGCAEDSFTDTGTTILEGISEDSELTTLDQAIDDAGLRSALIGTQYTFYAPTNQAFLDAGMNIGSMEEDSLLEILKYHMIPTRTDGSRLDVTYGKFAGTIVAGSTYATNWIGNLTYLGVQTLNLGVNANVYYTQSIEVLNNSSGTLNLEGFYINGAKVTEFDAFEGGDGVVHKIDKVLLPPSGSAGKAISADSELSLFDKLVKKASVNPNGIPSYSFSVLEALPANALAIARTGTLTVLAPTDAAMTAAGHTSVAIDGYTVALCYAIARQHVINLRWFSSDLKNQLFRDNPAVTTMILAPQAGLNITYNNTGASVFFSSTGTPTANIDTPDIVTTNGVIHKIDAVIQ